MCGFLTYKHGSQHDFSRIELRGGDGVNHWETDDFTFLHSLLSITGEFTQQPYVDGDIVCVYNGEIYNQPFTKSDGEVLIPMYKEHGWTFPKLLDGEFAIALYDFRKRIAVFATDTFGTKPMYVRGSEAASLKSGLTEAYRMPPNEIRAVDLVSGETLRNTFSHAFSMQQQVSESYDKWCLAFEESVKVRSKKRCFMGLSSGYDSGSIAHCLNKLGVDFKTFTISKGENIEIIKQRVKGLKEHEIIDSINEEALWRHIIKNVDNEEYTFGSKIQRCVYDDRAILGLASICEKGKAEERRVYISGQGSDEIMSDYAPFPMQSELHGVYPEDLKEWKNFRFGCQQSYITKEEHIAGSYGIETRYPFLDKAVVQAFLDLTTKLKNAHYKAPLRYYMLSRGIPFEENMKRGFSP